MSNCNLCWLFMSPWILQKANKEKQVNNLVLPFCKTFPLSSWFLWAVAMLWESCWLSISVYQVLLHLSRAWHWHELCWSSSTLPTPPSVPHPQAVSWHKKKPACIWKWSGASPSSAAELFVFIPLYLIKGEKPAKQMNASIKINVLKQGWKVQTSWVDFHRREGEESSG